MKRTTLQKLNRQQITDIYHTYMETDFPPDELRPLEEFMERIDRGIYECLGLYEEGELRAYGYFVKDEAARTVLLDFLAVCPAYRCGGYGGSFLKAMGAYYASCRGILIECESEQTAADDKELTVRRRRMAFYEKNGCARTLTRSCLFGVEFDILYLALGDAAECKRDAGVAETLDVPEVSKAPEVPGLPEVADQLRHMYALMFGEAGSRDCSRVWNRSSRIKQVQSWTGESIPLCQMGKLQKSGKEEAAETEEKTEAVEAAGTAEIIGVAEAVETVGAAQRFEQPVRQEKPALSAQPSLLTAFGFANLDEIPRIISLVGGGGKTTTMYQLADELAERGRKVLVTTSTHIMKPQTGQVAEIRHVRELQNVAWDGNILIAGTPVEALADTETGTPVEEPVHAAGIVPLMPMKKLAQPEGLGESAEMERLLELADVILIEADGAKRLPVKVPREGEPVLIPQTGLVIACAGLRAVGKTFDEACFRFEEQGQWLRRKGTDLIEAADLALILMDERGSRKNLDGRFYRIVLNQADGEKEQKLAEQVIRMFPVTMQRDCVVTGYYK